jgi:outer membrane protein assembly factor BamB
LKSHILVLLLTILFTAVLLFTIFTRNHPIEDTTLPQWGNQKQSDAVIPRSGYISLQAEAMDSVSLYKAVLSTNETGVWRNETEYAFLWMQPTVCGFDNFGTATYERNILYAPSKMDDKVYAINASNGDIIWNSTVRQCDASPCIDNNVLYVGECSGPHGEPTPKPKAIALNKTSGEELWHFTEPNGSEWVGSPLVCGDYVYYTTLGSGVYALNTTNGNPIWNRDIGYIVCSVGYDEGIIFVSGSNSTNPQGQYALNATTGDEIWSANYGASWDSSPVIYDGMVIQVVHNSVTGVWTTCVLNETDGKPIRRFDCKGSPSTPLVHDDKIFIPSYDWRMWAFNLDTGEESWHTVNLHDGTSQNYSYCSPAAAGGAIYYQSLNGTFCVINETDGNVLWSYALGGFGFGSSSVGDGKVFITNDAGVYAFKIGPGSGDWLMFCKNNLHRSYSEKGIDYVRYPLTQPNDFGNVSDLWMTAKFVWCNKMIDSAAIAWRIYFYDSLGNVNVTDTEIFYVNMPIHNVAIINVFPSEMEQNQTALIK